MSISSKAVISKEAVIGKNVEIAPFVHIDGNVKIGNGTKILSGSVIMGNVDIGKNNVFYANTVIGGEPQDIGFKGEMSYVKIGDNNIFREFTNVHRGTEPESSTIIGNNCFLMVGSHVAHNCVLDDNVTFINSAQIAGYVHVEKNVVMSGVTVVHQFVRIGEYAMLAALSRIGKDVPPYMLAQGYDSKIRTINVVGLRRAGMSQEIRNLIKKAYYILYHKGNNTTQALEKIEADNEMMKNKYIKHLVNFIKNSKRGILAHYK